MLQWLPINPVLTLPPDFTEVNSILLKKNAGLLKWSFISLEQNSNLLTQTLTTVGVYFS